MATLRIDDVPEDVLATLTPRADARGQSLSAYLNVELTRIAATPERVERAAGRSNAEIVERLRAMDRKAGAATKRRFEEFRASVGPQSISIREAIDEGRR